MHSAFDSCFIFVSPAANPKAVSDQDQPTIPIPSVWIQPLISIAQNHPSIYDTPRQNLGPPALCSRQIRQHRLVPQCDLSGQPTRPLHGPACELTETAENAVLEGQLTSGIFIRGNDVVNVVPMAGEVTTCADVWEFSRPAPDPPGPMTAR